MKNSSGNVIDGSAILRLPEFIPTPLVASDGKVEGLGSQTVLGRSALSEVIPFGGEQMVPLPDILPGDEAPSTIELRSHVATFPGTPNEDARPFD